MSELGTSLNEQGGRTILECIMHKPQCGWVLKREQKDAGFILITALVLIMGISALTVGFLKLNFESNSSARTLEHVMLGRVYAKSGIYRVFAAINDRNDQLERTAASLSSRYFPLKNVHHHPNECELQNNSDAKNG